MKTQLLLIVSVLIFTLFATVAIAYIVTDIIQLYQVPVLSEWKFYHTYGLICAYRIISFKMEDKKNDDGDDYEKNEREAKQFVRGIVIVLAMWGLAHFVSMFIIK
jgi:hypothetical protein